MPPQSSRGSAWSQNLTWQCCKCEGLNRYSDNKYSDNEYYLALVCKHDIRVCQCGRKRGNGRECDCICGCRRCGRGFVDTCSHRRCDRGCWIDNADTELKDRYDDRGGSFHGHFRQQGYPAGQIEGRMEYRHASAYHLDPLPNLQVSGTIRQRTSPPRTTLPLSRPSSLRVRSQTPHLNSPNSLLGHPGSARYHQETTRPQRSAVRRERKHQQLRCRQCPSDSTTRFYDGPTLGKHERRSHGAQVGPAPPQPKEGQYICSGCPRDIGKFFNSQRSLQRHIDAKHSTGPVKKYKCKLMRSDPEGLWECGSICNRFDIMKKHWADVHKEEFLPKRHRSRLHPDDELRMDGKWEEILV